MTNDVTEEQKEQVIAYFVKRSGKKTNFTIKDVIRGSKLQRSVAKKVVTALAKEGRLEFTSFGGATFIKLPDADA